MCPTALEPGTLHGRLRRPCNELITQRLMLYFNLKHTIRIKVETHFVYSHAKGFYQCKIFVSSLFGWIIHQNITIRDYIQTLL